MGLGGYVPFMRQFLSVCPAPRVLEIGVDQATTAVPLVVHMCRTKERFSYLGVDVLASERAVLMLSNIDYGPDQRVEYRIANSLDYLRECGDTYDLVIVDGDHNYHTVSTELALLEPRLHDGSVLMLDDYAGRWAERDGFYAERPEYAGCDIATKRVETEKHGVKPAVDEFLARRPDLVALKLMEGEPVVVAKRGLIQHAVDPGQAAVQPKGFDLGGSMFG